MTYDVSRQGAVDSWYVFRVRDPQYLCAGRESHCKNKRKNSLLNNRLVRVVIVVTYIGLKQWFSTPVLVIHCSAYFVYAHTDKNV